MAINWSNNLEPVQLNDLLERLRVPLVKRNLLPGVTCLWTR